MKERIIAKTINEKVENWLESLPTALADQVRNKVVVTGGSIASMFLRERVNDYDMYFRDIKTAILISQHYAVKWIDKNDKAAAAGKITKPIVPKLRLTFEEPDKLTDKIVKMFEHEESSARPDLGVIIAHPEDKGISSILEMKSNWSKLARVEIFIQSAGVVGNNPDEEYDYFETREPDDAVDYLSKTIMDENSVATTDKGKYNIVFMSSNAITLSDKVQLVIRFFGDPAEIHDTYDFVHATNYWTKKTGLVLNVKAMSALISKELIYVGSKYPLCSVIRSRKFIQRGWSIHAGNYLKMIMQAGDFDLTDPKVLSDQLVGIDAAYFVQVINAVKDKRKDDPNFVFTSTYLCTIVDRMMGTSEVDEDDLIQ